MRNPGINMRLAKNKILRGVLAAITLAAMLSIVPTACADDKTDLLGKLSDQSKSLTQKITATMVRVHLDPNQDMSPALKTAYDKWVKDGPGAGGGRRGGGEGRGGGGAPGQSNSPGPGAGPVLGPGPGPRGGMGGFGFGGVRRFLEERMNTTKDPQEIAEIRALMARNGQTEISGVAIDNAGHVLVLMPLVKSKDKLKVTMADGTETLAAIIGADFVRGLTMIKLDKPGATSSPISKAMPETGELLLTITATRGAVGWVVTPASGKSDFIDERFPMVNVDDRGPSFLFSTSGEMSAITVAGRQGLPLAPLEGKLAQLLEGKDLIPTPIGIRYTAMGEKNPYRIQYTKLGDQPAAIVDSVIAGSLAEKAGFKPKDFLVTIDGKPLSAQFFTNPSADLEARTGVVKFGILRDNKEIELQMNLDDH